MKTTSAIILTILLVIATASSIGASSVSSSSAQTYNINTLAGKANSIANTAPSFIAMSNFLQEEANMSDQPATSASDPITPTNVLTSPLDGTTITAPDVTVNQDKNAASQNEPTVAVDPNNPNRIVVGSNDYVARTWSCFIGSTPCSALADGYSGTYYSNDGGATWCCVATDPSQLGTLIPGVEHLTGGIYDAGGDPALAFNSQGNVFFAGLGFDRTAAPNTVTVSKGTFDGSGTLTWGAPTFINPTTSPAILNDKEWIASDSHASSPFRDNVYVSWTRFLFNPFNGMYVQSPIAFAFSTDGGQTFSTPQLIVGNVLYDQGSRPVVGPDGTVYVFFFGSTRSDILPGTWVVKSTDGGVSWSKPVEIAQLADMLTPRYTVFRVNSFPAAAVAPNGDVYAVWTSQTSDSTGELCIPETNTGCHAATFYSKSTDGGSTWSAPALAFPSVDASFRTAIGYPQGGLTAPAPRRVDTFFPAIAIAPNGNVYISAYAVDVNSPWQTCAKPASPTAVGRIDCLTLGGYVNNGRLDYVVIDLTTGITNTVTTQPINSRYHFGGGFIGDYTDIAVGSDNTFHAVWMDSNNVQTVTWWYGFEFVPTSVHQQDIATATGSF